MADANQLLCPQMHRPSAWVVFSCKDKKPTIGNLCPLHHALRLRWKKRYAQIEKEALAVTWACEQFSDYLIGVHFEIRTDHDPLVSLFGSKPLAELPPRIQHFRIRHPAFNATRHLGKDSRRLPRHRQVPSTQRATSAVWWPGASKDVDEIVKNRLSCAKLFENISKNGFMFTGCFTAIDTLNYAYQFCNASNHASIRLLV